MQTSTIRRAPAGPRIVRTIVVDGDLLVRQDLRMALEADGIAVVASARAFAEGLRLATGSRADVALVATTLPDGDGVDLIRRMVASSPRTKVIAVDRDGGLGLAALRAGAVGVVSSRPDPRALARIVRGVMAGEAGVSRAMMTEVLAELNRIGTPTGVRPVRSNLTAREWEVLDLLCEGANTTVLAEQLVLSVETVRSHIKSILRKLEVSSRADAVTVAYRLRQQATMTPVSSLVRAA